jgi:condensin complex subunit 3
MLRSSLLERAQDKETFVRLQAVIALAKLQRGEDEQNEEREVYLSDILIDMLQHDPAPYVHPSAYPYLIAYLCYTEKSVVLPS